MSEKRLAKKCHDELRERKEIRTGLDHLDSLPFASLPPVLLGNGEQTAVDAINSLISEGANGPAMQRLLSREIQISRAELRFAEMIRNLEASKFLRGTANERRLQLAERLVCDQSRRFIYALDLFTRLNSSPPTRIRVTAHQAIVNVGASA
jgi:hypothetical protein